jgi:hypothetical protein
MRFVFALFVGLLMANVSHAGPLGLFAPRGGCQGGNGCSGSSGGCSGATGGCSGVVMLNAGCMGMVPVMQGGCSGTLAGHRVVGMVRVPVASAPKQAPKLPPQTPGAAAEPQGATFAIVDQPRRVFIRLPPRRFAVRVD